MLRSDGPAGDGGVPRGGSPGPGGGRNFREEASGGSLKVAYLGTAEFAVGPLEAAARARGWEVAAVVTEPPQPKGRSMKPTPTPVAEAARRLDLPLREVATWRDEAAREWIRDLAPDVLITAAYGRLLPRVVLATARLGAVNLHGSLLPEWRGAAPVQRAIEAGDARTGVTIFVMDAGIDTGPILGAFPSDIPGDARADDVLATLSRIAAENLATTIDAWGRGEATPRPQPVASPTPYAVRIAKAEGALSWDLPAETIVRKVRAFHPWPGVTLPFGGERVAIRGAAARPTAAGVPGEILSRSPFLVACGDGTALEILRCARPGRNETDGPAFANGLRVKG